MWDVGRADHHLYEGKAGRPPPHHVLCPLDLGAMLPPEGTAELGVGSILTARWTCNPVLVRGLSALKLLLSPGCRSHGFLQ